MKNIKNVPENYDRKFSGDVQRSASFFFFDLTNTLIDNSKPVFHQQQR